MVSTSLVVVSNDPIQDITQVDTTDIIAVKQNEVPSNDMFGIAEPRVADWRVENTHFDPEAQAAIQRARSANRGSLYFSVSLA